MKIWTVSVYNKQIFTRHLLVGCLLLFTAAVSAQSLQLHVDSQQNQNYLRQLYTDSNNRHTSIRSFVDHVPSTLVTLSNQKNWRDLVYKRIVHDHQFQVRKDNYQLAVDFLPDFQMGKDFSSGKRTWLNTRGLVFQGKLGDDFYFYSDFYENQAVTPTYLDKLYAMNQVVPGQGFLRRNVGTAYDYSYSTGFIAYSPSKFFHFQLGHGKNFIGDGYRSMLLSDQAFNYPYLRITTNVWRFHYTNLYAEFQDLKAPRPGDIIFKKKYGTFHYLDCEVTKRFSLGLFESVIWRADDTTGYRGFDVNYLSPIIFYRPVEYSVGSPDNALLGVNLKYKLAKTVSLYGQFMLDEFKFDEYKNNKDWWANKYGYQIGFRYFDVLGIKNINLLAELNGARPYTYSQRDALFNYGHYNEALAHPLGANFRESIAILNYQVQRFNFRLQCNYSLYGKDTTGNVGKDIFKSYNSRDKEYYNYIGQGLTANFYYLDFKVWYLINPKNNWRIELTIAQRSEITTKGVDRDLFFNIGLRSSFRSLYADF